jgi:hypothetical protein
MAYFEGYRGFQQSFAPRAVGRAVSLLDEGRPARLILAPFYCMSLFGAPRRHMVASWLLLLFIVAFVIGVKWVPQPARGVIDAGVVVGLAWGLVSLLVESARAIISRTRRRA